ncbi:MAG: protein-export chaperone SecB [Phocaeicola sp.]
MESGFKIDDLLLLESSFSRIHNVVFEHVTNDLSINTEVGVNENKITVIEEVTLVQRFEAIEQVKIVIKMVGVFEATGASKITDLELFGKVNGAAILFPYIREHITTLTLKAGIPPIILPPVNFQNQND